MVRPAFTMIELIFALVIMGIVFVSLPLILINNAKSIEDNLIQESIFLTSSKITQIMSFQWDNSSSETGTGMLAASDVVNVTAGAAALVRNATTDFRVGHFQQDKRRRMTPVGNPRFATPVGPDVNDAGIFDDVDDFHGQTDAALVQSASALTSGSGYKKAYRTNTTVTYVDDDAGGTFFNGNTVQNFIFTTAAAGGTTNLKMIEVSVDQNNSGDWDTTLLLRAYVANIGETDYHKRRY
ncbi:MAG: prepilin-type N-terminal cleavage/methylation domain-containing protein [Campylobacterales bacterium]|nr:prepilin-type N-terminal cleavage/methylation domain-containing protein [Campylobacterales bacterium]